MFLLFELLAQAKKANDEFQSNKWFASWGWARQQETNKFSFLFSFQTTFERVGGVLVLFPFKPPFVFA
mgnify:FL=1